MTAKSHCAPAAIWPRQFCAAWNSCVVGWIDKIVIGASCLLFFRLMSAIFFGLLVTPTSSVPNFNDFGAALSAACTGVGVAVAVRVEVADAVGVTVAVAVGDAVTVAVLVAVGVEVAVAVAVAVAVRVAVTVAVALTVGVAVRV